MSYERSSEDSLLYPDVHDVRSVTPGKHQNHQQQQKVEVDESITFRSLAFKLEDEYTDAITNLDDLSTIHTDVTVAEIRARIWSSFHDDNELVKSILSRSESQGLASSIFRCFESTRENNKCLGGIESTAAILSPDFWRWATGRLPEMDYGEVGGPGKKPYDPITYRDFLLKEELYWCHMGTAREGNSAKAYDCYCPITVHLQLAIVRTRREEWATAATESDPSASPLALGWDLARRHPQVGRMTADVVALVTMGCTIERRTAGTAAAEEWLRKYPLHDRSEGVPPKGMLAEIGGELKKGCIRALARLQESSVDRANRLREQQIKDEDAEEARISLEYAAKKLREQGDRYAQCIEDGSTLEERKAIVHSIRALVLFIFAKSGPTVDREVGSEEAVPEALFRIIDELGKPD